MNMMNTDNNKYSQKLNEIFSLTTWFGLEQTIKILPACRCRACVSAGKFNYNNQRHPRSFL